jgi:hypothetical protein
MPGRDRAATNTPSAEDRAPELGKVAVAMTAARVFLIIFSLPLWILLTKVLCFRGFAPKITRTLICISHDGGSPSLAAKGRMRETRKSQ